MKTKKIVFVAMYLALFFVLDYLTQVIPFLQMPQGGSIGLSVVALLLASYHLGYKYGILTGLLSLIIQQLTGQIYIASPVQFLLEYPLAFGIYGLAVLIPNTKIGKLPVYWGIIVTNLVRMGFHIIAGAVYWGVTWGGSIIYNAPYMLATMVVSLVIVPIIYNRLKIVGIDAN
ncbi:MAG: energy-coupled thiamine transporter ThiT [Erysipelotrichaceae bacterium]|nr:energy-coupled thiamine transporter ThiT [Erysipelotrichaceae bacterium]